MDLSGFQMCHLSDDAHSILREKRVILGLACRVIEALGMDITDFYHGKYAFGEEVIFFARRLAIQENRKTHIRRRKIKKRRPQGNYLKGGALI